MNWTEEQIEIIKHKIGHAKVSAVAGSGKSATLIERIAMLLESGVNPAEIQAVMFNASASSSFKLKLKKRLKGTGFDIPEVRTFHSVGTSLCRELSGAGKIPHWRLESRDWVESKMASDSLIKFMGDKPTNDDTESFLNFIGLVKSDIISAADKHPEATEITGKPMPEYYVDAYEEFERRRAAEGVRFFADLIYDPVMRVINDEDLCDWIGNRLEHLLIDEYQDINEIQQALVCIIAGKKASVMVVGDVDQCIYEWRGARPEYIQTLFDADFPNATNYRLSYTFRYGHQLSMMANHVIGCNSRRDDKLCLSAPSTPNTQVELHEDGCGASAVANLLEQWVAGGRELKDTAILVRLYGLSAQIELSLLKHRIPYNIDGRDNVFSRQEARMILGYLRLAGDLIHQASPDGITPFDYGKAILSTPSLGISEREIDLLTQNLCMNPMLAREVVEQRVHAGAITEWKAKNLKARANLWHKVASMSGQSKASELIGEVINDLKLQETFMRQSIRQETGRDKIAICRSLQDFFGAMTINEALKEIDELMNEAAMAQFDNQSNVVTIMSVHKAKGLEWPLVILPGLKEGCFPAEDSNDAKGPRIEAERRLFYVAATRAKEKLCLIAPVDSELAFCKQNGIQHAEVIKPIASRFLYEANIQVSQKVGGAADNPKQNEDVMAVDCAIAKAYREMLDIDIDIKEMDIPKRSGGAICGPNAPFRGEVGMRVRHVSFGAGTIKTLIEKKGRYAITVALDKGGDRIVISNLDVLNEAD